MSKIKIKHKKGELPPNFNSTADAADENDLRVMLGLMFLSDENGIITDDSAFAKSLGMRESDLAASFKFWCGAGFVSVSKGSKKDKEQTETEPKKAIEAKSTNSANEIKTAHRDGVIERSDELTSYSTKELADLFDEKKVTQEFIDEAVRIIGKTMSAGNIGILAGLVDQLGFEEEAVLAILSYVYQNGKKSLRYAEKLTFALYDDGILSTDEVYKKLSALEKSKEISFKIKKMFGMGERELTTKEQKFFNNWVEKYGYGLEEIRLAFDITVDTKQAALPAYANSIIESWYSSGLRTANEIKAEAEKKKAEKNTSSGGKSFDIDEFFDAAMKRSYEDL